MRRGPQGELLPVEGARGNTHRHIPRWVCCSTAARLGPGRQPRGGQARKAVGCVDERGGQRRVWAQAGRPALDALICLYTTCRTRPTCFAFRPAAFPHNVRPYIPPSRPAACGASVTETFCAEAYGTAMTARQCVKCQATLSPGGEVLHHPVRSRGPRGPKLKLQTRPQVRGGVPSSRCRWERVLPVGSGQAARKGGSGGHGQHRRPGGRPGWRPRPPDISQRMSPDERFQPAQRPEPIDAIEQGDSAAATLGLLPMALAALRATGSQRHRSALSRRDPPRGRRGSPRRPRRSPIRLRPRVKDLPLLDR